MEKHGVEEKTARLAELEETLAQKIAIAEKLIAEKDKIIDRELRRYDEAAFYIRLQSSCFNLYPLLVRILLGMIDDPSRRMVFRSLINGKDINRLAARLAVTPEEIGTTFCTTVRSLSKRVEKMFDLFAASQRLDEENEELRRKYEEADTERECLHLRVNFCRNRIRTLEKSCREKEKIAKELRQKLKQETRKQRALERKKPCVETNPRPLTHADGGLAKIHGHFASFVKKLYAFAFTSFRPT